MQEYLPLLSLLILVITVLIFIRIPLLTTLLSLPYRLFVSLLKAVGIVKDNKRWSVVYDAKTKSPLDPAYVTVRNMLGVEIASMITDLNGRFALLLSRGLYVIDVQKTNYIFPAITLKGAHVDGKYKGLYYGETISIEDEERAVAIAIPMDPTENKDWNQQEKRRKNVFFRFGGESSYKGSEIFYCIIGIALTIYLCKLTPTYFYFSLLWVYGAVLAAIVVWHVFEPVRYTHSIIIDKKTKKPLAFARVTIFSAAQKTQVMRKVTSFEGQFAALLPSGKYYLMIEQRDEHGIYTTIFTSHTFRIHDGYIGRRFTV